MNKNLLLLGLIFCVSGLKAPSSSVRAAAADGAFNALPADVQAQHIEVVTTGGGSTGHARVHRAHLRKGSGKGGGASKGGGARSKAS